MVLSPSANRGRLRRLGLLVVTGLLVACNGAGEAESSGSGDAKTTEYVLAVSWQPAFCEFLSRKPECRSQTGNRFDATHFALHGLWPQPRSEAYCGVDQRTVARDKDGKWRSLPFDRLPRDVWTELTKVMPGTQSGLERHEWIKHGTCYSPGDNLEYFADSLLLMRALNASPVQDLFANAIGKKLTTTEIRAAFDDAFGKGTGERVKVSCRRDGDRQLINEITLGLTGEIKPEISIGELMLAAKPVDEGCPGGIIDPVGLQ